jgi:hypothetical protein
MPHQSTEANPFSQRVLAWVNGTTIYMPLFGVSVRWKHPRTKFITLTSARQQA